MSSSPSQTLRWVSASIAAVLSVCLAALTLVLIWFQFTVSDEAHFVSSANSVVQDEQFRSQLADDVAQDIMSSEKVNQYLGDGSDTGTFAGIQSWVKDRASNLVRSTVAGVVDSKDFRETWKEMASSTHSANFDDPSSSTLMVDAGPLYQAFNDRVQSTVHLDLGLDEGSHRVELENAPQDGGDAPMAKFLHRAQSLSAVSPALGAAALVVALLAALLAPRSKALFLALASAGTGLATWLAMTVLSARFNTQMGAVQGTEGLIAQHFGEAITANVQTWALTSMGVGLGIALVLVIGHVLTSARQGNTSHTF